MIMLSVIAALLVGAVIGYGIGHREGESVGYNSGFLVASIRMEGILKQHMAEWSSRKDGNR